MPAGKLTQFFLLSKLKVFLFRVVLQMPKSRWQQFLSVLDVSFRRRFPPLFFALRVMGIGYVCDFGVLGWMWVKMAGAMGLEPTTSGVTGRHCNQLNYAPAEVLRPCNIEVLAQSRQVNFFAFFAGRDFFSRRS